MIMFSQKDKRWGNLKLGGTNLKIKDYGCLLVCLSMLTEKPPYLLNDILRIGKAYTKDGLIIWGVASKLLRFSYEYLLKDPKKICIAETNTYAPKYPQHFVVWLGNGSIVDPLDGQRKPNQYNIVSYRRVDFA